MVTYFRFLSVFTLHQILNYPYYSTYFKFNVYCFSKSPRLALHVTTDTRPLSKIMYDKCVKLKGFKFQQLSDAFCSWKALRIQGI